MDDDEEEELENVKRILNEQIQSEEKK